MEKFMKIAVISDIHGNMQALESVLADIKKEGCNKIFCLGDFAMAGPEPDKTIDKVKELVKSPDFVIIQGNTDEYIGENSQTMADKIKIANPVMGAAYESDLKMIKPENIAFLRTLPSQKEVEISGVKILLVHGSPRANNENIFPGMPVEKVEEMIKGTDAEIIFCGHTHQPCGYQTNTRQTVVNVGSVGRPLSEVPKACYAVLEINENGEFYVEHRSVSYDKETASEILAARGFDGADKLAAMLLSASERYPS